MVLLIGQLFLASRLSLAILTFSDCILSPIYDFLKSLACQIFLAEPVRLV